MALKPTLYKVELQLVDTDRDIYDSCKLTLAQHPSETQERMMIRLMVYALNYHADLQFTKGLSSQDEPDLWQVSPSLEVEHWLEVGQASADRMRKGISRAPKVSLYAYGSETDIWWQKVEDQFSALPHIEVWKFDHRESQQLSNLVERKMQLTVSIAEGGIYLNAGEQELSLSLQRLL